VKVEKKYYWLAIDGESKPQWKKPFTPAGKSAVFKLMRKKSREPIPSKSGSTCGPVKFEIYSSRHDKPIWESGRFNLIFDMS
jgi:hypothetical protein